MLRTIELIVGLKPMTHFDAGARPMSAAFASKPDPRPYEAEKPRIPFPSTSAIRQNRPLRRDQRSSIYPRPIESTTTK
jgi:hypothetical protein